jgi:hypothetical protein
MIIGIAGCAGMPYEQLGLDTTSNFRQPPPDKVGIYVYQWKRGIIGAVVDVNFEIKGQSKIALNTGEYGYLEIPPGRYEYKIHGGLFPTFISVKFDAGQNYFFRAALVNFSDISYLIRDQKEIDEGRFQVRSATVLSQWVEGDD